MAGFHYPWITKHRSTSRRETTKQKNIPHLQPPPNANGKTTGKRQVFAQGTKPTANKSEI
jgi:hypothetical protein